MTDPRSSAPNDAAGAVGLRSESAALSLNEIAGGKFDEKLLEKSSWKDPLFEWVLSNPWRVMWVARFLRLLLKLPGLPWSIVWRYDDVREVLSKDAQFPVAWGERMIEVTRGRNFVLGMQHDNAYRLSYQELAKAFPLAEVPRRVEQPAADLAEGILRSKAAEGGELDAVQDLITAVPTRLCDSYFGIGIPDDVQFAKWTLATSAYVFGTSSKASDKALGNAAAAHLRETIRSSIALAKKLPRKDTVLKHMLEMGLDDDTIHAQFFGMILGYIPTNVLAGGNILETLLRRPEFLERARAAALADDDPLLWRCLREALRFRHINPGPWRICPLGYTVGEGGPSPTRIRPGRKVLAPIQTAMFDPDRVEDPYAFNPLRSDDNYMVFGFGQHWCIGFAIAKATATQTFKPLLKLKRLRAVRTLRAQAKRFNGFYPLHLDVGFEP
jgi:cytochrome P450